MIKTFPIIHCSPPPGKLAKGRKPISIGEEVAQKHSEWNQSLIGPCWHQQGVGGISDTPTTSQTGRRQFLSWQALFHAHIACADRHTHPRTSPCSREANLGLQSRRRRRPGTTLWVAGSHLRITLSRKAAQKHMDISVSRDHTGHYQGHRH